MDEDITEVRRTPPPPPPAAARAPETVRPGSVLGQLQIGSLLHRGASSESFQGQNLVARKPCVVKVFHPSLVASRVRWGRFVHESKAVAGLRQPGVLDVYNHQVVDGTGIAVLAPSEGKALRDLLRASGPLSRRAYVPVVRALGLTLASVHAAGIAHRRLHPGQVLVQWTGGEPVVQLLDFGIHHLHPPLTDEASAQARSVEQVLWVSPEQAKGEPGDARSDVYSLAALLYQMITGRPPFVGDTVKALLDQHLSEAPPQPSRFVNLAPELEESLLRALEKDPRKRTASIEAMLAAIAPGSVTGQHLLVKPALAASPSKEIHLGAAGAAALAEPAFALGATGKRMAVPPPPPLHAEALKVPKNRRLLFIALGVVVALCATVLGFGLLGGKSDRPAQNVRRDEARAPRPALPVRRAPPRRSPPVRPPVPVPAPAPAVPAPAAAAPPAVPPPPPSQPPPSPRPAGMNKGGAPIPGRAVLEVVTTDVAAQVFVDGRPRGIGRNVVVPGLAPGRHRVQLIISGQPGAEREVTLNPGERANVIF